MAEQVHDLLRSADYDQLAWGAYLAGQYRVLSAIPQLEGVLAQIELGNAPLSGPRQIEQTATALSVLDALVLLDARVEARRIEHFFDCCPVQTLILLRIPASGRDDVLLSLLGRASGSAWNAVANLLLETKPAGFGPALLAPLRFHLEVTVTNLERGIGSGFRAGSGGNGCNYAVLAPGLPPIADYALSPESSAATLLAAGPRPVFYVRRLPKSAGLFQPCSSPGSGRPSDQERLDYAVALIGPNRVGRTRIPATRRATVVWSNGDELLRRVAGLRRGPELEFRSLTETLVSTGHLTREEAARLPPVVDVTIIDERIDKTKPLPDVVSVHRR